MNLGKPSLFGALALTLALTLVGCSNSAPSAPTSPSNTPAATASPAAGASEPVENSSIETGLADSLTAPEWASEIYANVPEGQWVYSSDASQVVASTNTYDQSALQSYADSMIEAGWTVSLPADESNGYIIMLTRAETGEYITVVGMEKALPNGAGELTYPASSIVYKR